MNLFVKLSTVLLTASLLIVTTLFSLSHNAEAQSNFGEKVLKFDGITTTTRACASFPLADFAHAKVVADVTVANTSTVAIQYTNDGNWFTNGDTLSSSVTTDTPAVANDNLYTVTLRGKSTCVTVTPVNTNPITITTFLFSPARTN